MFLFRKPRVCFALLVILSVWVLHDRSSEMVTPRYFADFSSWKTTIIIATVKFLFFLSSSCLLGISYLEI